MTLQQVLQDADVKKSILVEVSIALDCSGSMVNEFADGTVARIFEMLQEFAKAVDNDGKMETIGFNTEATKVNSLNVGDNIPAFIARHYRAGGGTKYAGAIKGLLDFLDHKEPTILFVVTDGSPDDPDLTRSLLIEAKTKHPMKYIHFIRAGVDAVKVKFIEDVANELDNVGYSNVPNPRVDSNTFFKSLVTNELTFFLNSLS